MDSIHRSGRFSRVFIAAALLSAVMPLGLPAQQELSIEAPRASSFEITPGRMFSASPGKKAAESRKTAASPLASSVVSDVAEAIAIIKKNHADADNINNDNLASTSIGEMLRALDPHSRYFDRDSYAELMGEHRSEYHGTGVTIAEYHGEGTSGVYVISVVPESPAAAAGLRFGDRIIAVGDADAQGLNASEIRALIRGPKNTDVRINVLRAGSTGPVSFVVRRERLVQNTVSDSYLIDDNIGYIALDGGFSFTTAAEFAAAYIELKNAGARGLLIDLRGNTGGIFEQAVEIAEMFLPAGAKIVSQRARDEGNEQVWRSVNRAHETMPLVVLVDWNTASAAEILAGALQDNDRAMIVGTRTFGKGLVQNVIGLPDGSGLALTSARYYTPAGRSIQRDYSDQDLYDYFRQTEQGSAIADTLNVVRTTTGRPVYGGNGIAPDVTSARNEPNATDRKIHDAAFSSVRRAFAEGRAGASAKHYYEEMRRRILVGEDTADVDGIAGVIKTAGLSENQASSRSGEIAKTLRYNTALAVFGFRTAERFRVGDDQAVKTAIANIPRAATLAKAAERTRDRKKAR